MNDVIGICKFIIPFLMLIRQKNNMTATYSAFLWLKLEHTCFHVTTCEFYDTCRSICRLVYCFFSSVSPTFQFVCVVLTIYYYFFYIHRYTIWTSLLFLQYMFFFAFVIYFIFIFKPVTSHTLEADENLDCVSPPLQHAYTRRLTDPKKTLVCCKFLFSRHFRRSTIRSIWNLSRCPYTNTLSRKRSSMKKYLYDKTRAN